MHCGAVDVLRLKLQRCIVHVVVFTVLCSLWHVLVAVVSSLDMFFVCLAGLV